MRQFAIAVMLVGSALLGRQSLAQEFWYVPPGYGYGYYYGLDLGNGVGFGYGAGVGIPLSPAVFTGSTTGPAFQHWPQAPGAYEGTPAVGLQGSFTKPKPTKPTKPSAPKGFQAKKKKGSPGKHADGKS